MSAWDCIQRALLVSASESRLLTSVLADLQGDLDIDLETMLRADYAQGLPGLPPQELIKQISDGIKQFEVFAKQKQRALEIQSIVQSKLLRRFKVVENADVDSRTILQSFMAFDFTGAVRWDTTNHSKAKLTVKNDLQRHISEFHSRQNKREWKNGGTLESDLVREIHGEGTGNADAKSMADAFASMFEYARQRMNAAGGFVAKLENYWPQDNDAARMLQLGGVDGRNWARKVLDEIDLDWKKIGTMPDGSVVPVNKMKFLEDYYADVVFNRKTIAPMTITRDVNSKSLVETIGSARAMHFANADSWLKYHQLFGSGSDTPTLIHTWMNNAASQIATLETFGPDPDSTINALIWGMKKHAREQIVRSIQAKNRGLSPKERANLYKLSPEELEKKYALSRKEKQLLHEERTGEPGDLARVMWADIRGQATVSENAARGTLHANVRQITTGALLGSTMLVGLTDTVPMAFAAKVAGMPVASTVLKGVVQAAEGIGSFKRRKRALEVGWTVEVANAALVNASRFSGEVQGSKWARAFSERIMRLSGLITWTEVQRTTFSTEFAHMMTRNHATKWDALPADFRTMLDRHGISPTDWGLAQSVTPSTMANGVKMLTPADFMRGFADDVDYKDLKYRNHREIANKFQQMVAAETARAVPTPDERVRAILMGQTPPGSRVGELRRHFAFLKSFPVTLAMSQLTGMFFDERLFGGVPSRIAHASIFAAAMTTMGAVSLTLNGLIKGQTLPSYDITTDEGKNFWLRAVMIGGAGGYFGDLVLSTADKGQYGPMEYLFGPILGAGAKGLAAIPKTIKSDEPLQTAMEETWGIASQFMPGHTLWWSRLGYERLITDNISRMVESDPDDVFRRREDYAESIGAEYYSPPGSIP